MNAEQEEYLRRQDESGIEEGDTVMIMRKAESREPGWPDGWAPNMDETVGTCSKVGYVGSCGITLYNYNYPYFVLSITKKVAHE